MIDDQYFNHVSLAFVTFSLKQPKTAQSLQSLKAIHLKIEIFPSGTRLDINRQTELTMIRAKLLPLLIK